MSSTKHAAAVVAWARGGTPPPDWKIHVMPRRPLLAMSVVTFFVAGWAGGGLLALAKWRLFHDDAAPPLLTFLDWAPLPLAIAVGAVFFRIVWERLGPRGLVVVTDSEVAVHAPMQLFRRVKTLAFAGVSGMALQTVRSTGADTATTLTLYRLAVRRLNGKSDSWSPNVRYRYAATSNRAHALFADIVSQFNRSNSNNLDGLDAEVSETDYRFIT